MQYIDNDMDDLFRKAAEEYSLNTDTADWQKIAGALGDKDGERTIIVPFYKKYWLLLIVFSIGILSLPLFYLKNNKRPHADAQPNTALVFNEDSLTGSNEVQVPDQKRVLAIHQRDSLVTTIIPDKPHIDVQSESESPVSNRAISNVSSGNVVLQKDDHRRRPAPNRTQQENLNTSSKDDALQNEHYLNKPSANRSRQKKTNTYSNEDASINEDLHRSPAAYRTQQTHAPRDAQGNKTDLSKNTQNKTQGIEQKLGNTTYNKTEAIPAGSGNDPLIKPNAVSPFSNIVRESNSTVEPTEKQLFPYLKQHQLLIQQPPVVTVGGNISSAISIADQFKTRRIKPKRLYIGVVGGADLTSVSLQKLSNPGVHTGVMIGYQFSRKLSVESGFFIEKKNYYTDPEYFEKGRLYTSPNSTILSVDGTCIMYEIPLSIKYDLRNTYRSDWFVTAGLSSYFMRSENYSMLYRYNSSGNIVKHDYTYERSPTKLLSQLRLTGGYSYKLPAGFSLRVEPYVAIPINGVGHGKLNLLSTGINGGVFKRLF